jgi:hypothetical protein
MNEPTSTADYRKYPKGPNFGLIVALFVVALFAIIIGAWLLLSDKGKRLLPRTHDAHPTSEVIPLTLPAADAATIDPLTKAC